MSNRQVLPPEERVRRDFMDALDFALDEAGSEGIEFLRAWREGNEGNDWPEWQIFKEKRDEQVQSTANPA